MSGIPGEEPPIVTGVLASILLMTVGVEGSTGAGAGAEGISDPAQVGLLPTLITSADAQQATIGMPFNVKDIVCTGKADAASQPLLARASQQPVSAAVDVPAMAARTRIEENFMVIEIN
jgi:hypothetical protein